MDIELDRFRIESMLYGLKGAVTGKRGLPILSRILIEASGKSVTLTATDLETTVKISGAAWVSEEGTALPPGKNLISVIDTLKDSEIINIKTAKNKVVVTGGGKSSFRISNCSETINL